MGNIVGRFFSWRTLWARWAEWTAACHLPVHTVHSVHPVQNMGVTSVGVYTILGYILLLLNKLGSLWHGVKSGNACDHPGSRPSAVTPPQLRPVPHQYPAHPPSPRHPRRRHAAIVYQSALCHSFRELLCRVPFPKALPWADLFRPKNGAYRCSLRADKMCCGVCVGGTRIPKQSVGTRACQSRACECSVG